MITIDITMVIQIINILILIVIMNAVLYRPVRSMLEKREKKVTDLEKDIGTFNRNAKLRQEEFDLKVREARQKAKEEMEKFRQEAQAAGSGKLAAVRKDVDGHKAEQLSQIRSQFSSAEQELKGQIKDFANGMASKVLGRSLENA